MEIPVVFIIFFVLGGIIGIGAAFYGIMEHKRLIERAKKIDPTVRTRAEAEYVLKKDIAQSMGKNNND